MSCVIQANGRPAGCRLLWVGGGDAFGASVLAWLASGTVLYRPALRGGVPVAERATLQIHFAAAR